MTTYLKRHHKIHRNKESQSNHKRRFGFNFPISAHQKKIKDIFADARHFSNIFRVLLDTKCGSSLVFECIYGLSDALKSALSLDRNESYSKVFPFFFCVHLLGRAYGFSSHFSWILFNCYHQSTNAARWTEFKEEADIR